MSHSREDRATLLIAVLFFFSGAGSLVYQVVWVRMLVLVFGTTVFAVSTVLSAFMAGLALGSVYFGRLVDRKGNGLRIYAGLELLIGVCALLLVPVFAGLDNLYTGAYRALEGHPYLFALFRFALSFLVLLVPTTLIGGTLPVLSKFVVRRLPRVGRSVGVLYAVNTFGAAAGTIAVAFVLLERLGIRGTILVAAGVNFLIALASFLLSVRVTRRERGEPSVGAAPPPFESDRPLLSLPENAIRAVFWGYAVSGFVALGYEVIWTRLLSIAMRSTTTQSLSTTLIVFLFGLAVGGAVAARFVDRWRRLLPAFGVAELLLGLYGLASVAVFRAIPDIVGVLGPVYSFWGHIARLLAVACVAMVVPTFLMGILFPIAGKLYVRALDTVGRRVGGIYAANTTGAIFGAFAAGFVLIPLLGSQWSIQLLAWVNIAIGVVALLLDPVMRTRTRAVVLSAVAVPALILTFLFPSSFLVDLFRTRAARDLLYHDEGAAGTVTVLEFENGSRLLRVNGAGEVPTDHASIQIFRLLGSLPLLVHPAPEDVLVIAFGGGVTLASVELQRPGERGFDRGDVLDCAGREIDMRRRHQCGTIVHRLGEGLQRNVDAVRRLEDHGLDADPLLGQVLVDQRREVQFGGDDLRPIAEIDGARYCSQRARDARRQERLSFRSANDPRERGAHVGRRVQPVLVPRGGSVPVPQLDELAQRRARSLRQRAQRARVQVDRRLEDRELGAVRFG